MSLPNVELSKPVRLLGYISGSLATVALIGWAYLYADSVHQRHRAEALIADLKKFPFQSATFTTVREFTLSHGGSPYPASEYDPVCTPYRCSFEILIENKPLTFARYFTERYRLFHWLGIRPWGVMVSFTINDRKLQDSTTLIETVAYRHQIGSTDDPFQVVYAVASKSSSDSLENPPYDVYRPHVTSGIATDALRVRFLAADLAPAHAYDIDLHCLTAITSACTQSQLAPSAWADYHHQRD